MAHPITFGWYLPTHGDTTAFGDASQRVPAGASLFDDVVDAVDNGSFAYLLMPVAPTCWEATALGAWFASRTRNVAPLIAIRAGYVNPTQSARMFATLDQMSRGRVAINLIAGISDADTRADGVLDSKEVRYEKLDEEVQVMKLLWSSQRPIDFRGRHYQVSQVVEPKPFQRPHPPFFLGGGSAHAALVSARHSTVHLFWGETPESVRNTIASLNDLVAKIDRREPLQFGMRMHVIVRDTEEEAWEAARRLIEGAPPLTRLQDVGWGKEGIASIAATSEANRQMWRLLEQSGEEQRVHRHIWTGISSVRQGAGLCIVGTPKQVAETLEEYIDAGCTSFCLSGYPHAAAAREFAQNVIPLFRGRSSPVLPRAYANAGAPEREVNP
jgi:alkanesulfonate monooxygenase